jgi:hypothetical protein
MNVALRWLVAFVFTQAIEVPIYMRALGIRPDQGGGRARALAIAFGASLITHPIVWFVIPRLWLGRSYEAMVVASEIFAVGAEAIYLQRFGVHRAFAWSLTANAASAGLALLSRHFVGWP